MGSFIFPALVAVIVFTLYMVATQYMRRKDTVRERVKRLTLESGGTANETDFLEPEESTSSLAPMMESLLRAIGTNVDEKRREMQLQFTQAGITSPDAVVFFLFTKRFVFPICVLLALWLMLAPAEGAVRLVYIMVAFMLLIGGYMGPDIYVKNRKMKRQQVLQRSFPDTLDLILVCVESGLALDAALSRVCKELGHAHPEITKELNRTRMELTMLNDRGRALQNLSDRTDLLPFRSLVSALLQTEKFGTSLAETLRVLSDDYRHTRLMIAENKAGRLPALITIPLMLLMMPAFVLVLLGPAGLQVAKVMASH